mgnify:CR=1 FL=1
MKNNSSKYQSKSGFKVPENYFEELETNMMHILGEDENLLSTRKEKGFTTPANYFDNVEKEILSITIGQASQSKVISIFRKEYVLKIAAIAAVFIGIISIWFSKPEPEITIDNVEIAEIENYIDKEIIELNFTEISTLISQDGIVLDNLNTSKVNDDAVLEYLMDNVDDPDLLLK